MIPAVADELMSRQNEYTGTVGRLVVVSLRVVVDFGLGVVGFNVVVSFLVVVSFRFGRGGGSKCRRQFSSCCQIWFGCGGSQCSSRLRFGRGCGSCRRLASRFHR